ncbi:hypothetical protein ABET36_09665 [Caldifermentibacillus hisashii]|uniref:hypothetical protein n=1 Tax=Caldifermentibacillus hisashii TaxID=996558 RepID=UPI0017B9E4ED|nr:hypothetical protein [Caldifermentibacillus hisashii]NWN97921.1 hypothetical protein [Bacillus sp. (in: firmicutes)]
MFHFLGLLKAMSIPFIYMIVFGFISGFLPNMDLDLMIVLLFFPTYILIGILAPIYNKKTPYFASFIGSLSLSVLNFFFGHFFFELETLADPDRVNRSLVLSTSVSIITTSIFLFTKKRKVLKNV